MQATVAVEGTKLYRRREERFLAGEELTRSIIETVDQHLERVDHLFPWRTTTYCDTPDWQVFRAVRQGAARLRFREYHARRLDEALTSETLWLEVKEASPFMRKERTEFPARAVPALLRGEVAVPPTMERLGEEARALVAAGARPVLVTQYRRVAYAAPADRIRITADYDLEYLAISWPTRAGAEVPCRIGPAVAREPAIVIEMKWSHELPAWAGSVYESLRRHAIADDRPSKFMVGVQHILGPLNHAEPVIAAGLADSHRDGHAPARLNGTHPA